MKDCSLQPIPGRLRSFGIVAVLLLAVVGRASVYSHLHPEWANTLYVLVVPTLFFLLRRKDGLGRGENAAPGFYRWLRPLNPVLAGLGIVLALLFFTDCLLFEKLSAPPLYAGVRQLCIQLSFLGSIAAGALLWTKPIHDPTDFRGILPICWYGGLGAFADNLAVYDQNRVDPMIWQDMFTWILLPFYAAACLYFAGRRFLPKNR